MLRWEGMQANSQLQTGKKGQRGCRFDPVISQKHTAALIQTTDAQYPIMNTIHNYPHI